MRPWGQSLSNGTTRSSGATSHLMQGTFTSSRSNAPTAVNVSAFDCYNGLRPRPEPKERDTCDSTASLATRLFANTTIKPGSSMFETLWHLVGRLAFTRRSCDLTTDEECSSR